MDGTQNDVNRADGFCISKSHRCRQHAPSLEQTLKLNFKLQDDYIQTGDKLKEDPTRYALVRCWATTRNQNSFSVPQY